MEPNVLPIKCTLQQPSRPSRTGPAGLPAPRLLLSALLTLLLPGVLFESQGQVQSHLRAFAGMVLDFLDFPDLSAPGSPPCPVVTSLKWRSKGTDLE